MTQVQAICYIVRNVRGYSLKDAIAITDIAKKDLGQSYTLTATHAVRAFKPFDAPIEFTVF